MQQNSESRILRRLNRLSVRKAVLIGIFTISIFNIVSPTAVWRIRAERPFCMTRWRYVSKEVAFSLFFLCRSDRRPVDSNPRQQGASKALGGTFSLSPLIVEHQVYPHELSRRRAQSRVVQYYPLPLSTPDIPTALSDIWGSVHSDAVLQQIASSVGIRFLLNASSWISA